MIETLSMRHDNSVYGRQADQDQRIDGTIPVWSGDPATNDGKAVASTHKPFGFHDLLNMVNPLQHIPVVQNVYRAVSGDTIEPASQAMGDTLYGGPIGGAMSIVNILIGTVTGKDVQGHLASLAFGSNPSPAQNETKTATAVSTALMPATADAVGFEAISPAAGAPVARPVQHLAALEIKSPFDIY